MSTNNSGLIPGRLIAATAKGLISTSLEVNEAGQITVVDPVNGLSLTSPNGTRWKLTIDDSGTLVRTPVTP